MSVNKASLYEDLEYNENKPVINVLFETSFTKEIRIALKKGVEMKEHQSPFSIVIQIVEGTIEFGVDGNTHLLEKGQLISLDGHVPHNLLAKKDSIVRLTLTKADKAARVKSLVD
jgi:quercetin dioxygenase-like cupin family protein